MAVTHTDKNTPDHAGSMVRGDFDLAIKDNPRLCRGEKIAYGEGQSRQEKVSELE